MKNTAHLTSLIAVSLVCVFIGPLNAIAASTPSLGAAATYGVLGGTFTRNIAETAITGDLGYTTVSGSGTHAVTTGTDYGTGAPTPQARIDASSALTNLNSQACTFTFAAGAVNLAADTTHGTIGVYTPGVYCTAGAASIGTGGITLTGFGTYIFKISGALTSVDNSNVILSNSAASCDVFWVPTAATTLGANTTFKGTVIDNANAITVGSLTAWVGRALSLGAGTITTNTNTINSTCTTASKRGGGQKHGTINVIKTVINDSGGTKTVADFALFVNSTRVVSGITNDFPAPGPAYSITETGNANYTQSFSGGCDSDGRIALSPGENRVCIVTNNDIGAAAVPPVPPLIEVIKTANPLSLPDGPGPVTYTYTLRNIGTVPVASITMVGDTCSPIVLVSGDNNTNAQLEVAETWVHTCSKILPATHTNTVVAMGWANGISTTDIASATVVVGLPVIPPVIHVTKVPSVFTLPAPGGAVTYMYIVTNPGTAPLSNVNVTDDKCTSLPGRVVGHPGDLNDNNLLESNESWIFRCTSSLAQTTTNTAVASGWANGFMATDFALATVVVASPRLPNTGIPHGKESASWGVFVLVGILAASTHYLVHKKRST